MDDIKFMKKKPDSTVSRYGFGVGHRRRYHAFLWRDLAESEEISNLMKDSLTTNTSWSWSAEESSWTPHARKRRKKRPSSSG